METTSIDERQKQLAFEYCLYKFIEWFKEENSPRNNDLSILKSLKLLFFVSSVNADSDSDTNLVSRVFNKFYALPLGHVESVVYDYIKNTNGSLKYFTISDKTTTPKQDVNFKELILELEAEIKTLIDKSFERLKSINPKLILYSAYELVELSHQWLSWKTTIAEARSMGINGAEIPVNTILKEQKIFSLRTF